MTWFTITQRVRCDTLEQAEQVAAERLGYDEDYGFTYQFGECTVEPSEGVPGMTRLVKDVTGKITFADGQVVDFSLGIDTDSRWGNTHDVLGDAVVVCEQMRDGLWNAELFDDGLRECPNCQERVEPDDRWGGTSELAEFCSSCVHNARRSGWDG